jgi:outer membrane protein insertion porin family
MKRTPRTVACRTTVALIFGLVALLPCADLRAQDAEPAPGAAEAEVAEPGLPEAEAPGPEAVEPEEEREEIWVSRIVFQGNEHIKDSDLLAVMHTRKRGFLPFIWPGTFSPAVFDGDLDRIADECANQGFLDAVVVGDAVEAADGRSFVLYIAIEEGALYTLREVKFEGNTLFRDDELLEATPFRIDKPFSPAAKPAAEAAITRLYRDQGYWDVEVNRLMPAAGTLYVDWDPGAEGTDVTVSVRIREGEPVYIGQIRVEGLQKTREPVVRRNLTFYPGQLASARDLRESEAVLINSGYFDTSKLEPVSIELAPGDGAVRDAIVRVEEGQTGRVMLTGGVGSDAGLIVGATIIEENFDLYNWPSSWDDFWRGNAFRGGGQRMVITLNIGTERSYYAISFENPSIRNTGYSLGTSIYSRGVSRRDWDETRTGASLTVGERLTKFVKRDVTIGYENVDLDEISAWAAPDIQKYAGGNSKPFVRFSGRTERRDNRWMPSDGHAYGGEVELSAGDTETLKAEAYGATYWTVREDRGRHKHVLGLKGSVGVATSYSGDVPVYERFYAGGFTNMRGFEWQGISPSDGWTGDLVGGESMTVGTVEYSLPVTESDTVRLVGFWDVGTVHEDMVDVINIFEDLRMSVGMGVRWQVPMFGPAPIEISVAAPLLKESDDETQFIQFSVGAQRRF